MKDTEKHRAKPKGRESKRRKRKKNRKKEKICENVTEKHRKGINMVECENVNAAISNESLNRILSIV